jgi:hypothetical protein
LQSAYIVIDYKNDQIAMAQANPSDSPDDIYEIVNKILNATPATGLPSTFVLFVNSHATPLKSLSFNVPTITISTMPTTTAMSGSSSSSGLPTATGKTSMAAEKVKDIGFFNLIVLLLSAIFMV